MWKACLSEAAVADLLKKHFVVVSDPFGAQNDTPFGIHVWMFTHELKEVRNFWWGTGNCLIGAVFTEEYQQKRVKDMVRVLTEARQIAAGDLQAAGEVSGLIQRVDAEKNSITVQVGHGKKAKRYEFKLDDESRCVDGKNERKEVVPLRKGLKSDLVQVATPVQIATRTDKKGTMQVLEVRITGDPIPWKRLQDELRD